MGRSGDWSGGRPTPYHTRETLTCFGNPVHTSLRSYSQGFYEQIQEEQSLSNSDGLFLRSARKTLRVRWVRGWERLRKAEKGWDCSMQRSAKLHPHYGATQKKSIEYKMSTRQEKEDVQQKTSHLGQTCRKRRQIGKATYIVQSYDSIDKSKQIKHTPPAVGTQEEQSHSFRFGHCLVECLI